MYARLVQRSWLVFVQVLNARGMSQQRWLEYRMSSSDAVVWDTAIPGYRSACIVAVGTSHDMLSVCA